MPPVAESELAHLIRVSWIILIPVGVLLALVLYKLAMLLHSLLDFLTVARYDLAPAIQDLRRTAEHVEVLSNKAVQSVQSVENSVASVTPALNRGADRLKSASQKIRQGANSLLSGLIRSFGK